MFSLTFFDYPHDCTNNPKRSYFDEDCLFFKIPFQDDKKVQLVSCLLTELTLVWFPCVCLHDSYFWICGLESCLSTQQVDKNSRKQKPVNNEKLPSGECDQCVVARKIKLQSLMKLIRVSCLVLLLCSLFHKLWLWLRSSSFIVCLTSVCLSSFHYTVYLL